MSCPIEELKKNPLFPKFVWKGRFSPHLFTAAGARTTYDHLPQNPKKRVFGAYSFASTITEDPLWEDFAPCTFFEPLSTARSFLYSVSAPSLPAHWEEKRYLPDCSKWVEEIERTQTRIRLKDFSKCVLARRTTLHFGVEIDPWELVKALLLSSKRCTVFAYQSSPRSLFFGASPEKLFTRRGPVVCTEAVAGTRPLSAPDSELLLSFKDQSEFQIVKEWLNVALTSLCTHLQWNKKESVLKTSHVKHLRNRLRARLRDGIEHSTLIDALHPTPATAGAPRKSALKWLKEIEPFERGLYAAPIGWAEQNRCDFAVAIRSALYRKKALHLFTGAGIVEPSDPQGEWEEIEAKMGLLYELCTPHHQNVR